MTTACQLLAKDRGSEASGENGMLFEGAEADLLGPRLGIVLRTTLHPLTVPALSGTV